MHVFPVTSSGLRVSHRTTPASLLPTQVGGEVLPEPQPALAFSCSKKKQVVGIWGGHAEVIVTPRSITKAMGAEVSRPHVQVLCRHEWRPSPPCQGGLSSLTYRWAMCFSSGAGPHLPRALRPLPAYPETVEGHWWWGLLFVLCDAKSCWRRARATPATSNMKEEKAGMGCSLSLLCMVG